MIGLLWKKLYIDMIACLLNLIKSNVLQSTKSIYSLISYTNALAVNSIDEDELENDSYHHFSDKNHRSSVKTLWNNFWKPYFSIFSKTNLKINLSFNLKCKS